MNVTIAIATYNRQNILNFFVQALDEKLYKFNIRIYDDKSTEYDIEYLKQKFYFSKEIKIRETNYKADKNMYFIYKDFLKTKDDILVQLDSDMIVSKEFYKKLLEIFQEISKDDIGVYSLYNSNCHPFKEKGRRKRINGEDFYEKSDIGGACVIFPRKIVEKIIKEIIIKNEDYSCFDWKWSAYLKENNIPIYVSKKSYIQHVGLGGQNNKEISELDFGKNFEGTLSTEIQKFLLKYYEEILLSQYEELKKLKIENRKFRKTLFYKFKRKIRKILFGDK